jgi:hypothetical protein
MNALSTRLEGLLCAALVAVLAACGGGDSAGPGPDTTPATVTSRVTMPATAPAGTAVTPLPSVVVKNVRGDALQGVPVTFAVAAGGGTITGATQTTDAAGIATIGSWTLGTTAGENRVTATVGTLPAVTFTVTGVNTAATQVTKVNDNQSGTTGQALAQQIGVIVKDQFGNPVSGVQVTFAAQNGTSVAPTTVTTNASGAANTTWTLGSTTGVVHATATAGTLPAVTFTATAANASVTCAAVGALTIGGAAVQGSLRSTDCKFTPDNSPIDPYTMQVGTAPAVAVRMQSDSVDSYLLLYRGTYTDTVNIIAENGDSSATTKTAYLRMLLGTGNYVVAANSFGAPLYGPYSISAQTWSGNVDNCDEVHVTPGFTVNQTLTATDCNTGGDGRYSDDFLVKLRQGERLDVTMSSTAFDARIEIRGLDNSVQAFDDNGGGGTNAHIVFTSASERTFAIRATSASAGATGAYTLAVSTPPNPALIRPEIGVARRSTRIQSREPATMKRTNGVSRRR